MDPLIHQPPLFWYRDAKHSVAETDYVIQQEMKIIPIEVKAGKTGTLRSLHQFLASSPHDLAVRVSQHPLILETISSPDKKGRLLSVPFYLVWKLRDLVGQSLKKS